MEAEKIICCDRGDNDNALAAAILAGNNRRDNDGLYALLANQRNNNDPMAMEPGRQFPKCRNTRTIERSSYADG